MFLKNSSLPMTVMVLLTIITCIISHDSAEARLWCGIDKACGDCQRQAFSRYQSVNCWGGGRSASEQIQCSKDMSAWLESARASCVAMTVGGSRSPASDDDQASDEDKTMMQNIIDKSLETAKKLSSKCKDMSERLKEFSDRAKENVNAGYERFTNAITECMAN